MKLNITKCKVKNFLSVGAIPVEITYNAGIHAVIGKVIGSDTSNGVGKSTLFIDAFIFAFFGVSIRGLNKEDMINAINGSECEITLWFEMDGVPYRIERGIKPNYLRLINESEEVNEEKANLKDPQSDINKLLNISDTSFVNMITQNINYSKPFFKLKAAEKRQVLEDIMNLSVYGDMLERARKDYNQAKSDLKILTVEMNGLKETLQSKIQSFNDITQLKENFEKNKEESLTRLTETKLKLIKDLDELKQSLPDKDFKAILSNLNEVKSKINDKISSLRTEKSIKEREISEFTNKINRLQNNPVCHECNAATTAEHIKPHLENLEKQIASNKEFIDKSNATVKSLFEKLEDVKQKINKADSLADHVDSIKTKISNIETSIKNVSQQILDTSNQTLDVKNNISQDDIDKMKKRVEIKSSEMKEKDKLLMLADHARDRLGDKGIKSFTTRKIIPMLNKKMNEYLSMFKATYTITFDNELNETLKSRRRDVFKYSNFSAGEQKRIDLALMFALIDIAKSRNSIDCNILILDEILDTSLCQDGIASLLMFLKTELNRKYPNLCVYVVSHKTEIGEDNFNSVIHLKKENNFTKIDKIQEIQQVIQV
jgi:DNA repair exonuclease SbcCD ATPase subunit